MSKYVKDELAVIGNVLHSYTGRAFFSPSFLKTKNANLIARAFEGTNFVQQIRKRKATPQNKNPCSLVEACTKILLTPLSPHASSLCKDNKLGIHVPLDQSMKNPNGGEGSQVPCWIDSTDFRLFCYPEFSEDRQQLEPHTVDYSHIITNVRMQIC